VWVSCLTTTKVFRCLKSWLILKLLLLLWLVSSQ
jgi:hypothetical protein